MSWKQMLSYDPKKEITSNATKPSVLMAQSFFNTKSLSTSMTEFSDQTYLYMSSLRSLLLTMAHRKKHSHLSHLLSLLIDNLTGSDAVLNVLCHHGLTLSAGGFDNWMERLCEEETTMRLIREFGKDNVITFAYDNAQVRTKTSRSSLDKTPKSKMLIFTNIMIAVTSLKLHEVTRAMFRDQWLETERTLSGSVVVDFKKAYFDFLFNDLKCQCGMRCSNANGIARCGIRRVCQSGAFFRDRTCGLVVVDTEGDLVFSVCRACLETAGPGDGSTICGHPVGTLPDDLDEVSVCMGCYKVACVECSKKIAQSDAEWYCHGCREAEEPEEEEEGNDQMDMSRD